MDIQAWQNKMRQVVREKGETKVDLVDYLIDEFGGVLVKKEVVVRMPHQSVIPDAEYQARAGKVARWILDFMADKQWASKQFICTAGQELGMEYSTVERVCRKLAENKNPQSRQPYLLRRDTGSVEYKINK